MGDADELVAVVAAAESSSEHPLARAELTAAVEADLDLPTVEEVGRGLAPQVLELHRRGSAL